jgi:hypothetical protein
LSSTYTDIVIQLNSPGRVKFHLFQRLPNNIVGLPFTLLRCLDRGSLIDVPFIIDIEFAEGILKSEDLILLKLGILPL